MYTKSISNTENNSISMNKAIELFDSNLMYGFEVGTFKGLSDIHSFLFDGVYDFAGCIRSCNMSKGSFRFVPVIYLNDAIKCIEKLPHSSFDEIVYKYIEMNIAHPFRDGNGRCMRIWLDLMFRESIGKVVDWSKISKEDYFLAMERSPIKDIELKYLLSNALTDDISNREIFIRGIEQSFYYEGEIR